MVGPAQGFTWSFAQETALGTAGSYTELRPNEVPAFPTSTRQGMANPNLGHEHAYNQSDRPIWFQKYQEGAGSFATYIRRATSTGQNPISKLFESAGCSVATNSGTTVASYTSTTDWDLTATDGAHGQAGLLELDDGTYYPVLCADYTSDTVTPSMAIPSASSATNAWEVMSTITPYSRQVVSTKTLAFQQHNRATHTSGEDLAHTWTGCALSAVGDMVIKPFEAPSLEFTFHVGKAAQSSDAITAESFADGEKFVVINDSFCYETASASAAGGIARSVGTILEATITWGFECVPIPGEGDGTYAGLQGYIHKALVPKLAITSTFSKSAWTELEGSNTSQYIGLVQPTTSLTTPAFGFWMPNAHIDPETPPVVDFSSNDFVTGTVTYIADSAGYESAEDNSDAGAAPWYFAISGSSS